MSAVRRPRGRVGLLVCVLLASVSWMSPSVEAAATFVLINGDGAGEGLNDPAPYEATGGNTATTLGAARMQAVEYAVGVWANALSSPVPIRIRVQFDPLGGTADSAVLGRGGAEDVYRDFAGAPRAGTWYVAALADRLAGVDLSGGTADDILLVFNADVDGPEVMGGSRFDYGFAGAPASGDLDFDFVAVALHELAHGLGFTTFVDLSSGEKLFGFDDAYMLHLEHHGAVPADFASMSDGERLAALTAGSAVHWTGPEGVSAAAGVLSAGVSAEGHVEMHAPDPSVRGSLVHFAISLEPDDFMEPFYTGPETPFELPLAVFRDLGWTTDAQCVGLTLP